MGSMGTLAMSMHKLHASPSHGGLLGFVVATSQGSEVQPFQPSESFLRAPGGGKEKKLTLKACHWVFLCIQVSSGGLHLKILAMDADWKPDSSPHPSQCSGNLHHCFICTNGASSAFLVLEKKKN